MGILEFSLMSICSAQQELHDRSCEARLTNLKTKSWSHLPKNHNGERKPKQDSEFCKATQTSNPEAREASM